MLSVSGLSHFEIEDMFEEALQYKQSRAKLLKTRHMEEGDDFLDESMHDGIVRISVTALIAGSNSFRQHLLQLKTDSIYCSLMQSSLHSILSSSNIRFLAKDGKEIEISRSGSSVYVSKQNRTGIWYVLVSGKLKIRLDRSSMDVLEEGLQYELNPGEIFGGYGIQEVANEMDVVIETAQASKFIELSGELLNEFCKEHPVDAVRLLSMMGGNFISTFHFIFRIFLKMLYSGSTWQYVSSDRHRLAITTPSIASLPVVQVGRRNSIKEKARRPSLAMRTEGQDQIGNLAEQLRENDTFEEKRLSELELHRIKTGFNAIETVWRDISMGTDQIQSKLLSTIHKELGEIGSELFRRIFLSKAMPEQVSAFVHLWPNRKADL